MAKGGTMTIDHERINKTTVVLTLTGRLDTASSPLLEQKIKQWGNDIKELILDFAELSYISSMGLRVLLHAKKEMKQEGRTLTIKNMGASIRDVFEMTGFLQVMTGE
jgi:anti-sigma B factor antagonist